MDKNIKSIFLISAFLSLIFFINAIYFIHKGGVLSTTLAVISILLFIISFAVVVMQMSISFISKTIADLWDNIELSESLNPMYDFDLNVVKLLSVYNDKEKSMETIGAIIGFIEFHLSKSDDISLDLKERIQYVNICLLQCMVGYVLACYLEDSKMAKELLNLERKLRIKSWIMTNEYLGFYSYRYEIRK